jgi:hypothetical protein
MERSLPNTIKISPFRRWPFVAQSSQPMHPFPRLLNGTGVTTPVLGSSRYDPFPFRTLLRHVRIR